MSFYDGLSEPEIKTHLEKFKANYREQFGVALPEWLLYDGLAEIMREKQNEFIRQNFADLPASTLRLVQAKVNSNKTVPSDVRIDELIVDAVAETIAETAPNAVVRTKRKYTKRA